MKLRLTKRNIKSLLPGTKPYEVIDEDIRGFLLRIQPSGIMTYYLSYRTTTGLKKRFRIGHHGSLSPEQARELALKLTGKYLSGIDIQAEKKEKKLVKQENRPSLFSEFLENKYLPWITREKKDGKHHVGIIKKHFKAILDKPMQEINHCLLDNWRSHQIALNRNSASLNREIAYLRSCFSKAIEWGFLESHPFSKLKPLKIDNAARIRYLSAEEEIRLREALINREVKLKRARVQANLWRTARRYPLYPELPHHTFVDYLQPMVLLSINTGIRQGELFNLKWQTDINFERAILTVNGKTAKSKKTRHIPLNKEALSVLKQWHEQTSTHEFVFSSKDGKRLNNVRKSWDSLLTKANINNFRWHDLRHHFASKLAMAEVDLNTIRELLGHSDLTMTLRYAHLAPEHKAAAVAKLDNPLL